MATAAGREVPDLTAQMAATPRRFALGQALRLLGFLHARDSAGWESFIRDHVAVRPWLSLSFPASDIAGFEARDGRFTLTATGFGLYGTMGPLPTFYTEELLEEARRDESVSRDFLDILNNHLYHMLYQAETHNRLERRAVESPGEMPRHIQFCLMGQAEAALREPGPPRPGLVGLLAGRSRSAAQLARYLRRVLGRDDVAVEQCVERRVPIDRGQRCRLGAANNRLGEDAVLGAETRDSAGRFRLHLGCVVHGDMAYFLPGRPGHGLLAEKLRRFLDAPLEYDLALHPAPGPASPRPLGQGTRLGFFVGAPATCPPVTVFWRKD